MLSRGTKHACFPNHTPKFTKSVNIISDSFSFGLDVNLLHLELARIHYF